MLVAEPKAKRNSFQCRKKVKAIHLISCSLAYSITHITSLRQCPWSHTAFLFSIENEMREKRKKLKNKYFNNKKISRKLLVAWVKAWTWKNFKMDACVWCRCLFIAQLSSLPSRFSPFPRSLFVPSIQGYSHADNSETTVSGFMPIYLVFTLFWVFSDVAD